MAKQRIKIANYLNTAVGGSTESYNLMGTGFKELNEAPTAQVTSKRYINDKSATKSVTGYDWSSAFNADVIVSDEVLEYIVNIGEKQLTGEDSETTYVIVDLDKKEGTGTSSYKARRIKVAIEVATFGCEEGEVTIEGNLHAIDDVEEGTFDISTKKFTLSA